MRGRVAIELAQDDTILADDSLTSSDWLWAGAVVAGGLVVSVALSRLVRRLMLRATDSRLAALVVSRFVAYAVFLVALFYALTGLGVRVGPLVGAVGLGGLVLALALQKLVENFVGGLVLQARRPFTVDETVRLGEHLGVVADIDSRTVLLRGLDGTEIRIPNSSVLGETIVNLTRSPTRRSELTVGVAYGSNLDRAWSTIAEACRRTRRVLADPVPMVMLSQFGSSSIDFVVYYWHHSDVPSELAARHDLILAIHRAFAEQGITIAFPQVTVWSGDPSEQPGYDSVTGEEFTQHPALPTDTDQHPGSTRHRRWRRDR